MELNKYRQMYINGQWVDAVSGKKKASINPATSEQICEFAYGDREDAKIAIQAAKKAFYETGEWRRMSVTDKCDKLNAIADKILERAEELAYAECIDQGKPLREAEIDVNDTAACFRYYAGMIAKDAGETFEVPPAFGETFAMTLKEPVGVVGAITPWNYPMLFVSWKVAPALAAGNTVVLKPASITPLSTCILFEIFDEVDLPPGTVNLVMGSGSTVGQELAESMDVDMIHFTGSTSVGRDIAVAAAQSNLKKLGLELGGKSPVIVFDDCDFDNTVEWAMCACFFCMGEVCAAGTRLLLQDTIADKFIAELKARVERMTIGNPLNNPDIGAIVSEEQMNTVLNYIQIGRDEGATLLCGGDRYTEGECANGFFIKPTIFVDCEPNMRICQEEIFGPVLSILTFHTEEEAIEIANNSVYGLAGGIHTKDIGRALRVNKELRIGTDWINFYHAYPNEGMWGGYKQSGIGRELGKFSMDEFSETKQVMIKLDYEGPDWFTN